ncbi:MAG TPA: DUF1573 domain-containing protein [Capsulimonadaceae bacterium]|jgi:hypothetical protein
MKTHALVLQSCLIVALAHTALANAAPGDLRVQPGPHINLLASNRADIMLGSVSLLDTPTAGGSVTLANAGTEPVTITRVETSCGCTSAVIGDGGSTHVPYTIGAGGSVKLSAEILSSHLVPGTIRKTVTIESAAGDVVVTLAGEAIGPARFAEDDVNFGAVTLGKAARRRVNVILDRRVSGIPVRLVSGDRNVVAVQDGAAFDMPNGAKRISYTLSIVKTPRLGALSGMLTLLPSKPEASEGVPYPSVDIPIAGHVVSPTVTVTPPQVVFGLAAAGKPHVELVTLTGKGVAGIGIVSKSRDVSAKLLPAKATARKGHATQVAVTLSAKTVEGDVSTELIVTLKDGERFSIPVFATVSKFAVK